MEKKVFNYKQLAGYNIKYYQLMKQFKQMTETTLEGIANGQNAQLINDITQLQNWLGKFFLVLNDWHAYIASVDDFLPIEAKAIYETLAILVKNTEVYFLNHIMEPIKPIETSTIEYEQISEIPFDIKKIKQLDSDDFDITYKLLDTLHFILPNQTSFNIGYLKFPNGSYSPTIVLEYFKHLVKKHEMPYVIENKTTTTQLSKKMIP